MLIDFREKGREGEREVEKYQSVASHMCPDLGPNPQPTHLPWLGIPPVTFWFMGQCSNQMSHTSQDSVLSEFIAYHSKEDATSSESS